MKLYIKYMASIRSIMFVKSVLDTIGIRYRAVDIGEIDIFHVLNSDQYLQLRKALLMKGFELIDDKRIVLVERIKSIIVEMIRSHEACPKFNFSDYVSKRMNYDYTYLANLFSDVTGITIEYYVIAHKVERVKELLVYEGLNLSEISYRLDYSSVAHLSSQFKKVTGLTPSFYRRMKNIRRKSNVEVFVGARR